MSPIQPYEAWLFPDAFHKSEVDRTFAEWGTDEAGWQRWPVETDGVERVTVIGIEMVDRVAHVWVIRNGMTERHPGWSVRYLDIQKPSATPAVAA